MGTASSSKVTLSHTGKLYFPEDKITKGEVAAYYKRITKWFLPYVKDRPLMLERWPDGINSVSFYQRDKPYYFPEWLSSVIITKRIGGATEYVLCQNEQDLLFLVNQGTLTLHPWLSKKDRPDYPDRVVFDLDPPKEGFAFAIKAAHFIRTLVEKNGLVAFVMTTGSRGLHVAVPITTEYNFTIVRDWARFIAEKVADRYPENITLELRKDKRREKLFIDIMRNGYAQTAVAPYSLRSQQGAPIATPVAWEELRPSDVQPQKYTIHNIFRRLGQKGDPWQDFSWHARTLDISIVPRYSRRKKSLIGKKAMVEA